MIADKAKAIRDKQIFINFSIKFFVKMLKYKQKTLGENYEIGFKRLLIYYE